MLRPRTINNNHTTSFWRHANNGRAKKRVQKSHILVFVRMVCVGGDDDGRSDGRSVDWGDGREGICPFNDTCGPISGKAARKFRAETVYCSRSLCARTEHVLHAYIVVHVSVRYGGNGYCECVARSLGLSAKRRI